MSIEHIDCSSDFKRFFVYLNTSVHPLLKIQSWKEGEAIYGSTGWGCEKEETEEEKEDNGLEGIEGLSLKGFTPISATISSMQLIKEGDLQVWQLEANYVHMSSKCAHIYIFFS